MVRAIAVLIAMSALATSASAEIKAIRQSWGKAGVSYDQYRADAIECGHKGHDLDISQTDDAKAFVTASQRYETTLDSRSSSPTQDPTAAAADQTNQLAQITAGLNVDKRMANVGAMLQSTVDRCLTGKGYQRFDLTDDQRRHLGKMKIGSQERHDYLFRLASDPVVLEAQKPAVSPSDEQR